ncbi:hypothetical protein ACFQ8C_14895 [Streptomyces sp. NPDC056503]|uniref:hypothetical protein n=1 Tax=Streptomyces sp. NPDC056503 TaxID=3345842 RepID=UPI0036AB383F
MPTDPYAVLQALLRAEAARDRRAAEHRPEPSPAPAAEPAPASAAAPVPAADPARPRPHREPPVG